MLKFERLSFKSGTIVVKELWEDNGDPMVTFYTFKPKDNGKIAAYHDELYLLDKYPVLFTRVPD
jgi:hypothetical protein